MSRILKIILSSILLVFLSGGAYLGYRAYLKFNQPRFPALQAVPSASLAFCKTTDIHEAIYTFLQTDFWKPFREINRLKRFEHQYHQLDSIVNTYGEFNEVLENNPVIWAMLPLRNNDLSSLFIVELPATFADSDIKNFIEEINGPRSIIMKNPYRDAQIYTLNLSGIDKIAYFTVFRGLFIGGFNRGALQLSLDELYNQNPLSTQASFQQVNSTAGKNVTLNLYVRLPALLSYMEDKTNPFVKTLLERMKGLGDWCETDLLIHPDNLLLNGYSVSDDSSASGLSLFQQPPGTVHVPEILPFNVDWMLDYSIEDIRHYNKIRSQDLVFGEEIKSWKTHFQKSFSINIQNEFMEQLAGECSVAEISSMESQETKKLVILQVKDVLSAVLNLEGMVDKINRKTAHKEFQNTYQEFTIKALNANRLFQPLFGLAFPDFETSYYIAIKDYLVFADNPQTLIYLLKQYYARNTLSENANYKEFSNNISDKSNIFLYANLQRTFKQSPLLFDPSVRTDVGQYIHAIGNFEAVALQFSFINQMFYTNLFLKYNPDYQDVVPDSWESKLNVAVSGKPFLVSNHRSGKLNVLVSDEQNTIYLLDHVGNIQWTKNLSGSIMGEIHTIDFYGNGKLQYLFNTANFIYLVDINSHDVEDFPRALPAVATSPLAVFDFNKDKDYRIFIGLSDNRIYDFDKRGKPVEGWNKIQCRSEINLPVEHLVLDDKDYLFVTDKEGQVLICNRRGEERIHLKQKFNRAKNSIIYLNQTNSKGAFITTDENGQLVYISTKGDVKYTSFGKFSKKHFFLYHDTDHDGSVDFIFCDGNELQVFDRFKNPVFEQEVPEIINDAPVLYPGNGNLVIAVLLPISGEIRLYSSEGRMFENRVIKGHRPFSMGSIQGDMKLNLVTGDEDKVVNYSLSRGE